jgi:hypothetical protein
VSAAGASDRDGDRRRHTLRARVEALGPVLRDQGTLVRKRRGGRDYWYLRFYTSGPEGRKYRSLYVGDDAGADLVRTLLVELRAPATFRAESLALAESALRLGRVLRRSGRPGA